MLRAGLAVSRLVTPVTHSKGPSWVSGLPWLLAGVALASLAYWWLGSSSQPVVRREPGADQAPGSLGAGSQTNVVLTGQLTRGSGQPADLPGVWPQFRGPNRDNICAEPLVLQRSWPAGGPRQLWVVPVGEGYAAPVVWNGRVYLMDYDEERKQDALRCLSLADGQEIWRFAYPVSIKRNHGRSRTVPAVNGKYVVAMGPKCHVVCLDAVTGQLRWGLDLVRQFGATVPQWYAGQCPLIDGDRVILAPGGPEVLLMAVDLATGKEVWRTPNFKPDWKMTHSSVMPMDWAGRRSYLYCGSLGVVAVSTQDGSVLWTNLLWRISIATVPSPLVLPEGRVFLTGGYDAGSLMLQVKAADGRLSVEPLFRLPPTVFGAIQHTPIYFDGHIYGVRSDGQFACLTVDGKIRWTSGANNQFGLGAFLMAGGLIYALHDSGRLSLFEATPSRFNLLAQAQVLQGREAWGPMALVGGRLLLRDYTRLVCLEVGAPQRALQAQVP